MWSRTARWFPGCGWTWTRWTSKEGDMNGSSGAGGAEVLAELERAKETWEEVARVSEESRAALREREFRLEAEAILKERLAAAAGLPEVVKRKLGQQLAVREGDAARFGRAAGYEEAVAAAFEAEVATLRAMVEETGRRRIVRGCGAV